VLTVHLWHGSDHRLIMANIGPPLAASCADMGLSEELRALAWSTQLSTDEPRFGGAGRKAGIAAGSVHMPPNTLAWLTATQ
jgi:hypothetical protein